MTSEQFEKLIESQLAIYKMLAKIEENTRRKARTRRPVDESKAKPESKDAVRFYMVECGWGESKSEKESDTFWNHYEANGWTQGKGKPIRDWKAAVRNWMKPKGFNTDPKKNSPQSVYLP